MNKLGFGLMRLPKIDPNDPTTIDFDTFKQMVDLFLAQGFTYFDTAWMYMKFRSEAATREALTSRYPHDRYTLATKLHAGYIKTKEDRDRIFAQQLENTGVEYFDYYLIHGVEEENIEKYESLDCFRWLMDKRDAGLVKKAGFSFHAGPELLDRLLTEWPMDFVQLQLNYLDWENPAIRARECYEVATRHGVPVVVMEPVKGGTLAALPAEAEAILRAVHPDWSIASWAIRFVAGLENVKIVLSGMSTPEQVRDNAETMLHCEALNETELEALWKAVAIMNSGKSIPCTGCSYCVDGCPQRIPIPQYFSLFNAEEQEADPKAWHPQETYYANLIKTHGKASDCLACGQCEGICPQHLPIISLLEKVAGRFE